MGTAVQVRMAVQSHVHVEVLLTALTHALECADLAARSRAGQAFVATAASGKDATFMTFMARMTFMPSWGHYCSAWIWLRWWGAEPCYDHVLSGAARESELVYSTDRGRRQFRWLQLLQVQVII